MRIAITGGSGRIGALLVQTLRARGDEVTLLSRSPGRGVQWHPEGEAAPADALAGRDAVVHLAGEDVAQRWNDDVKRRIRDSRVLGTRNLVAGLAAVPEGERPSVLVSGSASGYYGPRGAEEVDEDTPPGDGFLARVCVEWEEAAVEAEALGLRVARIRTGIVLDQEGGALAKMLPFFRLGLGGPVASGRQQMPWIHREDEVRMIVAALDDARWTGPFNAGAPAPVTNKEFAKALGRALHRPAIFPVPGFAIGLLFGEMASIVTTGVRMVPSRATKLGFAFAHPELDGALRSALER